MLNHKKTAAMLASLMLCASAVMPSASFAATQYENWESSDDSGETIYVDENGNEIGNEDALYDSFTVSGDFSYSETSDGNACIEMCTSAEKDLVIPDTLDGKKVTYIGAKAFGRDPENNPFETIALPASIEYISADNPFLYCENLTEITVDSGNADYSASDGILYTKDGSKLLCYPRAKKGDSLTIDSKVTELGTAAVSMTELKNITFPSGLEYIGRHALSNNEDLTSADLSKTQVTDIGNFAFGGCTNLSDVKLPETLDTIGGGAFADCASLKNIDLNKGLLSVGQSAFANTALSYIIIPSSVQSIDYSAFGYNIDDNGTETAVPNFTVVGEEGSAAQTYATDSDTDYNYQNNFAFMTPENFTESQELKDLEKITEGDFTYAIVDGNAVIVGCTSSEMELEVPSEFDGHKVTAVYTTGFTNCQASYIVLPETVTEIRKGAFYGCQSLMAVKLPQSVKTIGEAAFGDCPILKNADLGGAEELGESLFENCPMLQVITISGNCKTINGDEPFIEYDNLREINVTEGGDGSFSSRDGVLYTKDGTMLMAYPASREATSFKVPEDVTTLANSAFAHNNYLEEIDLSNVVEIGAYAFEKCEVLKKVIMSKELTTLGPDAFYNCNNLKSLRFYDKLEKLGTYSFGFYYHDEINLIEDEADQQPSDELVSDFVVYAPKDSVAYHYAKDYGIKVKTGTIEIGDANVSVPFLIIMGVLVIGLVIALILAVTAKSRKAKKEEKEMAKIKADVAEKLKAKKENKPSEEDKNEDK